MNRSLTSSRDRIRTCDPVINRTQPAIPTLWSETGEDGRNAPETSDAPLKSLLKSDDPIFGGLLFWCARSTAVLEEEG